ncbi:MAG: hypothetical protein ACJ8FY_03055 [Gemmataceae bacterium]
MRLKNLSPWPPPQISCRFPSVGVDSLAFEQRDELRDLTTVIPSMAEQLSQHAFDIPPIVAAVIRIP